MRIQAVYILLSLMILFACKTGQNRSFIKTKKERQVVLVGAQAPHVLFVIESGDTLKFSSSDFYSELNEQHRKQIKRQGYLSDQSEYELSQTLKNLSSDTVVFQKLSAVDSRTLSGMLDTWMARELLLKGKASVGLKSQIEQPKKLKYVFLNDILGGQQGTFYTEAGRKLYMTIIAFGE